MLGNIVLLCFPVMVLALCKMCSGFRRNALFCAAFAFIIFFFAASGSIFGSGPSGTEGDKLCTLYANAEALPFDVLGNIQCAPGYLLLIKLCSLAGADVNVFVMIAAGICAVSASLFIYRRCSSSYEGAFIFAAGFMITAYVSLSAFIAVTICAHASAYVQDRRFFRAAAFAVLSACFDTSALMVVLYYLISFILNVYISSAVCAAGAAAFAFIPGMADAVYSIFGEGTYCIHRTQILSASFVTAGALTAVLMTPMLRNRNEGLTCHIPLLCGGAAMMFAAAGDGRLFVPALALTMPAMVILAPDVHRIAVRFAQILFPEHSTRSGYTVTAVMAAAALIPYVFLILNCCCGTEAFGISLFGEAGPV